MEVLFKLQHECKSYDKFKKSSNNLIDYGTVVI